MLAVAALVVVEPAFWHFLIGFSISPMRVSFFFSFVNNSLAGHSEISCLPVVRFGIVSWHPRVRKDVPQDREGDEKDEYGQTDPLQHGLPLSARKSFC